jgi:hypothetical protein
LQKNTWKDRVPAICAAIREQEGPRFPGKPQKSESQVERRIFGEKEYLMRTSEIWGLLLGQEGSYDLVFGKEFDGETGSHPAWFKKSIFGDQFRAL